jgi:hypothetical protein
MPYPDAKYPPHQTLLAEWRRALQAIRNDCRNYLAADVSRLDMKMMIQGTLDCANNSLRKEGE